MKWTTSFVLAAACGALVVAPSANANAVLSTSGATSPIANGSTLEVRAASNVTITFASGTITCASNLSTPAYGSLKEGTLISNTVTGTSTNGLRTRMASIPAGKLIFGNLMPASQTSSSPCPTTITGISSCTVAIPTGFDLDAQVISAGAAADTGISVLAGTAARPIVANAVCAASSGGTLTCTYTAGSAASGPVEGVAPYVGSPSRATDLAFTNQPFHRSGGPATCPATSPANPMLVGVTYRLYTASGSLVSAWQSGPKP